MTRADAALSIALAELLKAVDRHARKLRATVDHPAIERDGVIVASLRNELTVFDLDVRRPLRDLLAELDGDGQ